MPGIAGLITKLPREAAISQLERMVGVLHREPTDRIGTWVDDRLGVYVGWVVRSGSFSDGMPLHNEKGDRVLVFSGEEFPEPETRGRLRERGHELETAECSYLVHLSEEDQDFPVGLNGLFHGLLVDQNRRSALLFNDRYGMGRLYYHEASDAFYFSAEAKAILNVRPELRRMDSRSLGEFVSCGSVLENRTLFEGIQVLPPAAAWVFRNGDLESRASYFSPKEWEEQESLGPESFYQELLQAFRRNLPRYLAGRQRVAMSLTGGLDTRMIMAWQQREAESLPCYTFGGMLRDCKDVTVARRVARACRQPHEVIRVGEEFLERFPYYAEQSVYLTEGSVDLSRAPDLYLNEKARELAPVRLTGNYGGEVLRRIRAFKPVAPMPGLFQGELIGAAHQAKETYAQVIRCHPVSFAVFKQGPWHHQGVFSLEQTQVSMCSPFLDNDVVRTAFRAPESALASNEASLRLIADGSHDLLRIRTDRGVAGDSTLTGTISRGFLEVLFKAEYACDMGMPQWAARINHVLSPLHLDRLFLGRHKIFHFRMWYRSALAGYVREMLLDSRSLSRSYIERKGLEAIVNGHTNGFGNYTTEIHKLLTLEIFHRHFLDHARTGCVEERAGILAAYQGS